MMRTGDNWKKQIRGGQIREQTIDRERKSQYQSYLKSDTRACERKKERNRKEQKKKEEEKREKKKQNKQNKSQTICA